MTSDHNLKKTGIPITIVGLPYAGKTTLVTWLKERRFTRPKPTVGLNFEQIKIGDFHYNVFDLSGHEVYREKIWQEYITTSIGIIFVLDSSDKRKIREAKEWFWKIVKEWMSGIFSEKVVLFLANKSDLVKSMKVEEIINLMDLNQMVKIPNISFQIFKTSIRNGSNIDFATKWFFSRTKQELSKYDEKPKAIIVTDILGNPYFVHDPDKIVDDAGMFIAYLAALRGFSDELLGKERFKVIRVEPFYFFVCEEDNFVVSVAVKKEESIPEARRIAILIQGYLQQNKENQKVVERYIMRFL
ncbi:MAG: ADP-ribosylation factor-like protein [Candidatus Heimdallarchaeaceae archaeon]